MSVPDQRQRRRVHGHETWKAQRPYASQVHGPSDKRASARAVATHPDSSVEQRLDFLHVVDPEASLQERRQEIGNGQLALWLVAVSPQRNDGACAT